MYQLERFETYISIDELMENYFDFDITHERCSKCELYQGTWACPAFDFDPADFVKGFSRFHFIVDRVPTADAATVDDAQNRLFAEKTPFDTEMREREKELPGSYGLAAQECVACKTCARQVGKPCIHPDIMRYGPESIGLLAVKMIEEKFGFPVLWSDGTSIPDYYVLAAGVLEK
ncbi:MAG: hypothetical protein IKU44_04005 [Firmicutes bacterium]|nr:hypothetical protein [Bacillota bacterium]